ncbi:MAG: cupin domain-containing protein [Proteobacteria bacterium]|nr:cupin domain-containing protein [Pseudomonadota bacterium]
MTEAFRTFCKKEGDRDAFGWDGVEPRPYKDDDRALFRAVTRQVLFSHPRMAGELRYFAVAAGGFTTLERHDHMHAVMVLHGRGSCLVGDMVKAIKYLDLITVPSMTWHQFCAEGDEPLGFLCMVDAQRDRPQLPTVADIARLRADARVAAFLEATLPPA